MTTTNSILFDDQGHVVAYPPSLEGQVHHIILSGQDEGWRCDRLVRLSMDLASVWPTVAPQIVHLHDHEGCLYYRTTGYPEVAEAILQALWLEHDGCDTVMPMRPRDKLYWRQCSFVRFPVAEDHPWPKGAV